MTARQPSALVDADILIKLSILDVFADCLSAIGLKVAECATIESMRYSAGLHKQHVRERKAGVGAPAARLLATLRTISGISSISPDEQRLSTAIVAHSNRLGLAIDPGEAIIISVCVRRQIPYVTTGDKKAIRSLPDLERAVAEVANIKGKLIPFEYLLQQLVLKKGYATVHAKLVAGQHCDTGLRNALKAAGVDGDRFLARLETKLGELRKEAPGYVIA